MPRSTPVRQVMATEVVSFAPTDNVQDAMTTMVETGVDGAPVVDTDGTVVGLISTGDLIVQESQSSRSSVPASSSRRPRRRSTRTSARPSVPRWARS